jgi:hypothetical protein
VIPDEETVESDSLWAARNLMSGRESMQNEDMMVSYTSRTMQKKIGQGPGVIERCMLYGERDDNGRRPGNAE